MIFCIWFYILEKKDIDYYIDYSYINEFDKMFKLYSQSDAFEIKCLILSILKKSENYVISDKIIYNCDDIPSDMVECEYCGNIWDGFAQCNCF